MADSGRMRAFASCTTDLVHYMGMLIPEGTTDLIRVTRIAVPSDGYRCGCGELADWYVLRMVGETRPVPETHLWTRESDRHLKSEPLLERRITDPAYIKDTADYEEWVRGKDGPHLQEGQRGQEKSPRDS